MAESEVRFDGRAVVVTGGGRGLGRTQALVLAERGASVVVADNGTAMDGESPDSAPAHAVAAEIAGAGGSAVACTADLSVEEGANAAVAASLEAFGRIDGIIHYASTCPDPKTADKLSSHDLELAVRVNTFAGVWMARAAWPHMQRQNYGRIVYLPSGGIIGAFGASEYAAAKASYIGLIRCLALEGVQDGILVNGIAPSARTRMTERLPESDYATWFLETMAPEKVAMGGAYLLSDACAVHGEIFMMGGGRVSRLTLAESEGVLDAGTSIEAVRDAMPRIMADEQFFYPADLGARSVKVSAMFGFGSEGQANDTYTSGQIK